ncbi:MAG: hypothetical protein AB9836_02450 [Aminipila sp.]
MKNRKQTLFWGSISIIIIGFILNFVPNISRVVAAEIVLSGVVLIIITYILEYIKKKNN